MNISVIFLYFIIYSFFGWVIEVIHRSMERRQFVNPGFLRGPLLPIYGFATLMLLAVSRFILQLPVAVEIVLYAGITTTAEYFTGFILEKGFGMKLWDYSDERFNFHGRISLKYSVFWVLLSFAFVYVIHPVISSFIGGFNKDFIRYASISAGIYFAADFSHSLARMFSFRQKVAYLLENYLSLENPEIQDIFKSIKHFLNSFPDLKKTLQERLDLDLKERIITKLGEFKKEMNNLKNGRLPRDEEYNSIVEDIIANAEFRRLENFYHHNSSILEHVKNVSYLSYKVAKYLGFDYKSAARGGLLHDFFHYNWRENEGRPYENKRHGFEHPKIALRNAEKNFKINSIERDIIIKHMWPLTFIPPHYKESFVVTFVDKYLSTRELFEKAKENRVKRNLLRKNSE